MRFILLVMCWVLASTGLLWGLEGGIAEGEVDNVRGIRYEGHFDFGRGAFGLDCPVDFQVQRMGQELLLELTNAQLAVPPFDSTVLLHQDQTQPVQRLSWEESDHSNPLISIRMDGERLNNFRKALLSAVYQRMVKIKQLALSEWEDFVRKSRIIGNISPSEFLAWLKPEESVKGEERVHVNPEAELTPRPHSWLSRGETRGFKGPSPWMVLALLLGGAGAWMGYHLLQLKGGGEDQSPFGVEVPGNKIEAAKEPMINTPSPALRDISGKEKAEEEQPPVNPTVRPCEDCPLVTDLHLLWPGGDRWVGGFPEGKEKIVYYLANANWKVREIARELRWGQGEVRLVINLRQGQV